MNTTPVLRALALVLALTSTALHAQVPQIINYQGRVAVGTTNFTGSGAFKFALVNATGTTTYWSNDGTSTAGSQPTAASRSRSRRASTPCSSATPRWRA